MQQNILESEVEAFTHVSDRFSKIEDRIRPVSGLVRTVSKKNRLDMRLKTGFQKTDLSVKTSKIGE